MTTNTKIRRAIAVIEAAGYVAMPREDCVKLESLISDLTEGVDTLDDMADDVSEDNSIEGVVADTRYGISASMLSQQD